MQQAYHKLVFILLLFTTIVWGQNSFSTKEYYPIADNNEWRYSAPEGWKDGDYISKIEVDSLNIADFYKRYSEELPTIFKKSQKI